jgi:hypothetical protein
MVLRHNVSSTLTKLIQCVRDRPRNCPRISDRMGSSQGHAILRRAQIYRPSIVRRAIRQLGLVVHG